MEKMKIFQAYGIDLSPFFNMFYPKNLDICNFIVGGVYNNIRNHLM